MATRGIPRRHPKPANPNPRLVYREAGKAPVTAYFQKYIDDPFPVWQRIMDKMDNQEEQQ